MNHRHPASPILKAPIRGIHRIICTIICGSFLAGLTLSPRGLPAAEHQFRVMFHDQIRKESFTGRVYLFFTKDGRKEPRFGPDWFRPEPFAAIEVSGWKPGETLTIQTAKPGRLLTYPEQFSDLDLSDHRVQAVARFNPWERAVGNGAGNGFSDVLAVAEVDSATKDDLPPLIIDHIVTERRFEETAASKLLEVRSELLSKFHRRDVSMRASVLLPASYERSPDRRYPVIFTIPGFGGTHLEGRRTQSQQEANERGIEFLRVVLDPSCPLGHHVFADSANNGPAGTALVTELLPELDKRFRTVAAPTARFLTGHSSGGWSSLWVQVTHPDVFGGTWSTAPDSVTFQDFSAIDLTKPDTNFYFRDAAGREPRPIARRGDQVLIWLRDFDRMEEVVGPGGQLHSFEAVFGPKGSDGRPVRLWNRDSGRVDSAVAKAWEAYDIRLVLERNWPTIGPQLKGKLHVFMGELDTFYLNGATQLLKESLDKLGSDAVVEIHPGKDHGSLMTPDLLRRIRAEMTTAFLRHHEP